MCLHVGLRDTSGFPTGVFACRDRAQGSRVKGQKKDDVTKGVGVFLRSRGEVCTSERKSCSILGTRAIKNALACVLFWARVRSRTHSHVFYFGHACDQERTRMCEIKHKRGRERGREGEREEE